jgi:putative transposase
MRRVVDWSYRKRRGFPARRVPAVLTEYLMHYNTARPHRSLSQLAPTQAEAGPPEPVNLAEHRTHRKQVLGGLTHEYYIAA